MQNTTTDPGRSAARRFRKPSWRDPRFVLGLFLVLVSVLGVIGIVRWNDRTAPFWVAKHDIAVGDQISAEDFEPAQVQLGSSAGRYRSAERGFERGAVATHRIAGGQVLPVASIGRRDQLDRKPVTVSMKKDLAEGIHAGQTVDVWVAEPASTGNTFKDPSQLVSGSEVVRVIQDDDALGGSTEVSVQILVGSEDLAPVIKASSGDSKVTLVPSFQDVAQ